MDDLSPHGGGRRRSARSCSRNGSCCRQRGVPFSVGIVGTRENLPRHARTARPARSGASTSGSTPTSASRTITRADELEAIRARRSAFRPEQPALSRAWASPARRGSGRSTSTTRATCGAASSWRRCSATCSATAGRRLDAPASCPVATCHCYVGHMHIVDLDFRAVYGRFLAARIPLAWHAAIRPPGGADEAGPTAGGMGRGTHASAGVEDGLAEPLGLRARRAGSGRPGPSRRFPACRRRRTDRRWLRVEADLVDVGQGDLVGRGRLEAALDHEPAVGQRVAPAQKRGELEHEQRQQDQEAERREDVGLGELLAQARRGRG